MSSGVGTGDQIAITGIGAVTPLGVGAEVLHQRWTAGESGIADGFGRCTDFNPQALLSRKEIRACDRYSQLALIASDESVASAGWADELPYPPERIGCIVATAAGGVETLEAETDSVRERGFDRASPLTITRYMPNAAASMLAQRHGIRGECLGVAAACASGGQALISAVRLLRSGEVDAVLVAATDAPLAPCVTAALTSMGATSPSGISRPFDRRRDGLVAAEGAAAVILEPAESTHLRGGNPLAYVRGYGATCDAHHISAPEPSAAHPARAIELALGNSAVGPNELDYVNSHGTATRLNDAVETRALELALGEAARRIPTSSLKSAIGHSMGAAGLIEVVATVLALRARVAPPTLNLEEPDEELRLDYVPIDAKPFENSADQPIAISNSFGFGGHNTVIVIQAAIDERS